MGTFNLLRHGLFAHKPTTATVISALAATVVAWGGQPGFDVPAPTQSARSSRGPALRRHQRCRDAGPDGVVGFSHYVLALQTLTADNIAKFLGIALGTLLRFWAYRRFVFAGEPIDARSTPSVDDPEPTVDDRR